MDPLIKMRDRRNTNLSISSTTSSPSGAVSSTRSSLHEKWHPASPLPSIVLPPPASRTSYFRHLLTSRWMATLLKCAGTIAALVLLWRHVLTGSDSITSGFSPARNSMFASNADLDWNGTLPEAPSVVVVSDQTGENRRWTISIPPARGFPLPSRQYEDLCQQCVAMKGRLMPSSRSFRSKDWHQKSGFFSHDPTFLDIDRAETIGALPRAEPSSTGNVCARSLTFAFDESDAAFGQSLLLLWMTYGLAKKEGRAFFIDDSRWPYGSYTSYFAPPPSQGCRPPPAEHIVPCPHSAKHLVISSTTAPWMFDASFDRIFLRQFRRGVERSRRVYDLLRRGYDDLFHLVGDDGVYAASRVSQWKEAAEQVHGQVVGIHIRRGDRHPVEYQFSHDYLPLERYAEAAHQLRGGVRSLSHIDTDNRPESPISTIFLASDDPAVLSYPDLWHAISPIPLHPAQERIQLATKATLDRASPTNPQDATAALTPHVGENAGWEGGFYKALFLGLGKPRQRFAGEGQDLPLSEQGLHLRQLIGRAYLLDLAALSQADAVVCAVSSATCRVLGVMMGWHNIKEGAWVNVDDGRSWSWDGRR